VANTPQSQPVNPKVLPVRLSLSHKALLIIRCGEIEKKLGGVTWLMVNEQGSHSDIYRISNCR
jgi:hypothetical protein